ncbi:MAG: hypothetical protein BMS9Abin12_1176 [Acidimicrobiia bacterium]|nr:MAG: hypothetical protein BMS9Abin12_1176 [Acidimicrobiia bacterium]
MTRRIIGTVLIVVAGGLAVAILSTGRPLLPHMLGPAILASIGIWLLVVRRG